MAIPTEFKYTTAQTAAVVVAPGAGERLEIQSASLQSVGSASAKLEFESGPLPVVAVDADGVSHLQGKFPGAVDEPLTITCDAGDITAIIQYASL